MCTEHRREGIARGQEMMLICSMISKLQNYIPFLTFSIRVLDICVATKR